MKLIHTISSVRNDNEDYVVLCTDLIEQRQEDGAFTMPFSYKVPS